MRESTARGTLEASRAGTESSRQNMASRMDKAMRGQGKGSERKIKERGSGRYMADMGVLYRNEKLGEGTPRAEEV